MSIRTNISTFIQEKYHGVITFLFLLIVWSIVSRLQLVAPQTLPAPHTIAATFVKLLSTGILPKSLGSSLVRISEGFMIGTSLGLLLGSLMGVSRTAERLFAPLVNAVRQVPIIGWIPLIIVWCGIADLSKITFIAIGAFFPMVFSTFEGVRSVSGAYVEVARVFEFNRWKLLRKVIIPGALPNIVTGLRLSLGTSWMLVVWSEVNTRSALGIGDMLDSAREGARMDVVLVCIIVIGLVAFLINELLGLLEAHLSSWKKTYR